MAETMVLRACPFCGGEAYQREWRDESLWSHEIVPWREVGCHNCDIEMRSCDSDDAISQWNTRRRAKNAVPHV